MNVTCHAVGASNAASGTESPAQSAAGQEAATAAAAVKPEPTSPAATFKQDAGAAAADATQAAGAAAAQMGIRQDPASATQASQAMQDVGLGQTQAYGAQQSSVAQAQGNELTQVYEAVSQIDPWNALEIMWDSDTPPGWPKLICPWQVGALSTSCALTLLQCPSSAVCCQYCCTALCKLIGRFLWFAQ